MMISFLAQTAPAAAAGQEVPVLAGHGRGAAAGGAGRRAAPAGGPAAPRRHERHAAAGAFLHALLGAQAGDQRDAGPVCGGAPRRPL
jgi:hypothetical protein